MTERAASLMPAGMLDINLEALPLEVSPDQQLLTLGRGQNSTAYRVGVHGDTILKITRAFGPLQDMQSLQQVFQLECDSSQRYMGEEHLPQTMYQTVPRRATARSYRTVTVQHTLKGSL